MNGARWSLRIGGMAGGLLVWTSALVGLYALHAVGCKISWLEVAVGPVSLLRMVLLAVWLAHLGLLAWLCLRFRRWRSDAAGAGDRFIVAASVALTVVAFVATLYTGVPAVFLRQCS